VSDDDLFGVARALGRRYVAPLGQSGHGEECHCEQEADA
jgi:hypothetical protein